MLMHVDLMLEWMGPATGVVSLTAAGVIYTVGWRRYRAKLPRRFGPRQLAAFLAGLAALVVAVASPLDQAAEQSLSAHMIQHLLLLAVAPALLLLGQPLLPFLRGLPGSWRRPFVAAFRSRLLRGAVHSLTHPLVALLLSSAVFWAWHLPGLFQLALRSPTIHLVEHASFFVTGSLFWYPVVLPWPGRPRWPRGAIIPYLLVADLQNTALAAILTFSDRLLYPFYQVPVGATEASALGDQVLAGVIMWVPMSFVYLVPAAVISIRLLSPATRPHRPVVLQLERRFHHANHHHLR